MRCYVCHGVDTYEDRMTRFCALRRPGAFHRRERASKGLLPMWGEDILCRD